MERYFVISYVFSKLNNAGIGIGSITVMTNVGGYPRKKEILGFIQQKEKDSSDAVILNIIELKKEDYNCYVS